MSSSRAPGPPAVTTGEAAVTAAGYLALFLVGAVQGLIGTFQYGRGPAPLAAVLFDAAILVTCVLGSWGMGAAAGGVLPAVGWLIVTLALTSFATAGGSVIVTNTPAGMWFLYGGALCAAAGAVYAVARWSRLGRERRAGRRPR